MGFVKLLIAFLLVNYSNAQQQYLRETPLTQGEFSEQYAASRRVLEEAEGAQDARQLFFTSFAAGGLQLDRQIQTQQIQTQSLGQSQVTSQATHQVPQPQQQNVGYSHPQYFINEFGQMMMLIPQQQEYIQPQQINIIDQYGNMILSPIYQHFIHPQQHPTSQLLQPQLLHQIVPQQLVETHAYLPPPPAAVVEQPVEEVIEEPVLVHKETTKLVKQPVYPPAVFQKQIFAIKNPIRVLTYSDLCTVYPYQSKLSKCALKKAALPELHHPDIQLVPSQTQNNPSSTNQTPKIPPKQKPNNNNNNKRPSGIRDVISPDSKTGGVLALEPPFDQNEDQNDEEQVTAPSNKKEKIISTTTTKKPKRSSRRSSRRSKNKTTTTTTTEKPFKLA